MQIIYSELINQFHELLGTPKELVLETFNKPDATDFVSNRCVSMKNFGGFSLIVVFETENDIVRFTNAYRVYPKLLDGMDISKMKPVEVLTEFMNRYGVSKSLPGLGEYKIFIDRKAKIFFPGILDIEKYLEALKTI
jgi:hypothetical protein